MADISILIKDTLQIHGRLKSLQKYLIKPYKSTVAQNKFLKLHGFGQHITFHATHCISNVLE